MRHLLFSCVFILAACADIPSEEELNSSPSALKWHCSATERCDIGEGDCNNNSHCLAGLACVVDVGEQFGMASDTDVCLPSHCGDGVQNQDETDIDCGGECGTCSVCPPAFREGSPEFCSPECPCDSFEGVCQTDNDCAPGLGCMVPAPPEEGAFRIEYAICMPLACLRSEIGSSTFCNNECPCDAGMGDCDADTQCSYGLVCGSDNAGQFHDGIGRGVGKFEVCVAPHCTNGIWDGSAGETGTDCGGECGECLAPHCENGIRDKASGETGIDCGGPDCGRCRF